MTKWLSDRVTEWPSDQVTEWPSDRVTEMTGWQDDRKLRRRLTVWYIYISCLVWDSRSQKSVWIMLLQFMRESLEADSSHLYAGAACPHLHCGDCGDGGGNCLLSYINVSVSLHWRCELKLAWLLSFLHCHHAFLAQFLSLVWSCLDLNSVEYKTLHTI